MSENITTAPQKGGLNGYHVLALVCLFFGGLIFANVHFISMAVETHRGEDVPKSYRQGLEYNQTLARRAAQRELGWIVDLQTVEGRSTLTILDKAGQAVTGLDLSGTLRHPVDRNRDVVLDFVEGLGGVYSADLPDVSGRWALQAAAYNAPLTLQSELEL